MKVQILLPLYNPDKYLDEQIESINNQTYKDLSLFIRDDGSKKEKLKSEAYFKKVKDLRYEKGENLGVVASFLYLLKNSSEECLYYAFSDQDDYWKPNKIERAIEQLKKYDHIPAIYCASLNVVDENLNELGSLSPRKKGPSYNNALVQNIATGCTIVMNKKARNLINKYEPITENIVMHDWWVYLLISAFGKVIYDSEKVLLYRQHSNNTYGSGHGPVQRWIKRVKRFLKKNEAGIGYKQILEFNRLCKSDLDIEKTVLLEEFINSRKNLMKRVIFSCKNRVYRQNFFENIVSHVLLIFNKW